MVSWTKIVYSLNASAIQGARSALAASSLDNIWRQRAALAGFAAMPSPLSSYVAYSRIANANPPSAAKFK